MLNFLLANIKIFLLNKCFLYAFLLYVLVNQSASSDDICMFDQLDFNHAQVMTSQSCEVISQSSFESYTKVETTFSREVSHSQSSLYSTSSQQNPSVKSQGNSSDVSVSDHSVTANDAGNNNVFFYVQWNLSGCDLSPSHSKFSNIFLRKIKCF